MRDWNVIPNVREGPGHEQALLAGLKRLGEFQHTSFHNVCCGRVQDPPAFLETVRESQAADEAWTQSLARIVPVERTFHFDAEQFIEKEAVAPFAERMGSGRFFVRIERRGMLGQVHSQEAEREVGESLIEILEARGVKLATGWRR